METLSESQEVLTRTSTATLNRQPKVVVIGGGISGLAALRALVLSGFEHASLIEAKSVLGGRISTREYGNHVLEIGAQWIHGEDDNPVYEIAQGHDLAFTSADDDIRRKGSVTRPIMTSSEDDDDYFYLSNGERIDEDLVDETCLALDNIFDDADKFSRENVPLSEENDSVGTFVRRQFYKYLQTCGKSGREKRIMEGLLQWRFTAENLDNACTSLYEMSLYGWGQYLECPGNSSVPLKHGFSRIIDVITEGISKENIKLNTSVRSICWTGEAVESAKSDVTGPTESAHVPNDEHLLTFRNSDHSNSTSRDNPIRNPGHSAPVVINTESEEIIEADHVIVTCSLGYLKQHAPVMFQPPLPDDKMAAIQRMGFGTVDKIYLEFEKPFWDKTCEGIQFVWLPGEKFVLNCLENKYVDEYGDWWRALHGFDTVQFHHNLLCGWLAGDEAVVMETIPDHVIVDVCHELLQRFTENSDLPKPVRITRSAWHSDPYTLGSYSYLKMHSTASDCEVLAQPVLSNQTPRILFAGEATHNAYFSTTHGALLSGQREAQRLIDAYSAQAH